MPVHQAPDNLGPTALPANSCPRPRYRFLLQPPLTDPSEHRQTLRPDPAPARLVGQRQDDPVSWEVTRFPNVLHHSERCESH